MITNKLGFVVGAIALTTVGTMAAYVQFSTTSETAEAASTTNAALAEAQPITVYKSPSCGCCQSWVEHLETHGFETDVVNSDALYDIKQEQGVPRQLSSCHTAIVDGHVIEGHVPAADILAYLENPVFANGGLAVPGMPQGSPGMETGRVDDYQVVAFDAQGKAQVFREYTQ